MINWSVYAQQNDCLKNNGDENKPDKNTIVEQISSASVIVNGDVKTQKCIKFYNVLSTDYSILYNLTNNSW